MVYNELNYIIDWRGKLVLFLLDRDVALTFILNEKRWEKHDNSPKIIRGASIYESGREYDEISFEEAKAIYKDCPPDNWLPRDNEDIHEWYRRITPKPEMELKRNEKKRINMNELKVISEFTEKRDENESCDILQTTTIYECPCGKGRFIYKKEHTGYFDDYCSNLICDDCKEHYYSKYF